MTLRELGPYRVFSLGWLMEQIDKEVLGLVVEVLHLNGKAEAMEQYVNNMLTSPDIPAGYGDLARQFAVGLRDQVNRGKNSIAVDAFAVFAVAEKFELMGFPDCAEAAHELVEKVQGKGNIGQADIAQALAPAMRRDLKRIKLFRLPADKIGLFENPQLFGDDVFKAFPSARRDIEEAGNCIAMSRNTAAVFHLMRVVEVGLRATAKSLGIPDPLTGTDRNWAFMLGNESNKRGIWAELDRRNKQKDPAWQLERSFYEDAHAHLWAVKRAWRDDTMHVGESYEPGQARNIYDMVKGLMQDLASRVSE